LQIGTVCILSRSFQKATGKTNCTTCSYFFKLTYRFNRCNAVYADKTGVGASGSSEIALIHGTPSILSFEG